MRLARLEDLAGSGADRGEGGPIRAGADRGEGGQFVFA
jgi:hypothetical protein